MALAYYNEIDPYAAQWLRNLITAGHIAPGVVDERSIEDVAPSDLEGFTQCHFFAGIGVWSLALRRAEWPDSRPIWTGSCPCQPFSAAGKGTGFADERHLWPSFHWLIEQCSPGVVFGEQVASKAVEPWLDLVQIDLEAMGYAFGAVAFPSAGVGAPHIRDRLFWVGNASSAGLEGLPRHGSAAGRQGSIGPVAETGVSDGMADLHSNGCSEGRQRIATPRNDGAIGNGAACGVGYADSEHTGRNSGTGPGEKEGPELRPVGDVPGAPGATDGPGPTNGFWADPDWLLCRGGKWRPVEPGAFPLANGVANRVGRLRAYGNAINAEAAAQFIAAYMECRPTWL